MKNKIVLIFSTVILAVVILCGCDKGKPEIKDISLMPDNNQEQTVEEIPNGDEDIPPIADIVALGTDEYNDRAFKEKGYNELTDYYNELVIGFNTINKMYADDTVPQSDEIEEMTAVLSKKIEEVNESIADAKTYEDALNALARIRELEGEVEKVIGDIDKIRVTKR